MGNEDQVLPRFVEQPYPARREIEEDHEPVEDGLEALPEVERRVRGLDDSIQDLELLAAALGLLRPRAELRVAPGQRLRHEIERAAQLSDLVVSFRRHPEPEVPSRHLGSRRLQPPDPSAGASGDEDDCQHEEDRAGTAVGERHAGQRTHGTFSLRERSEEPDRPPVSADHRAHEKPAVAVL